MIAFEVKDMTCGHCVGAITKALHAADRDAQVRIDLGSHRVDIEPAKADATVLIDAIRQAGFTPVALETGQSEDRVSGAPIQRSGCCCG